VVSKGERLAEFLRRLGDAIPARTADEARAQLGEVLDAVEDDLTVTPNDPCAWRSDGRLYPPRDDARRTVPGNMQVTRFRSLAHNTFFGANGSIEIREGADWQRGRVIFEKPGLDGKTIWEQRS